MFYSNAVLTKGSLAKIWLAAHMESKLTKNQIGAVDVEQSVKDILTGDDEPIALRVSGQLLLGVCRIYSRKAKYLLDDCNDALVTIKMQIRPALVDLSEKQLQASNNDINIDDTDLNLDWDIDFAPYIPPGDNLDNLDDVSINGLDFDAPFDPRNIELGPSDGFASQDFGMNLGLDIGMDDDDDEADPDDTMSAVEIGRDAPGSKRHVRESMFGDLGGIRAGDLSMGGGDISMGGDGGMDMGADMDFQPQMDLGLDIGMDLGVDDHPAREGDDGLGGMGMDVDMEAGGMEKIPELSPTGEGRGSRASSRLSTPPAGTASVQDSSVANLSPTTAARINALALKQAASAAAQSTQKKKKTVRVIVDETTELESQQATGSSQSARNRDLSSILAPQRFIPSSTAVIRLLEIRNDPLAHYFPTHNGAGAQQVLYAGPKGLGPELASMFMFPTAMLRRRREAESPEDDEEEKRKRARTEESDEVEVGRRQSRALSLGIGSARGGAGIDDTSFGNFGGVDDVFGPGGADDMPFNLDDNNLPPLVDDQLEPQEFNPDGTPKARKPRAPRRRKVIRRNSDGEEEVFSELEEDIEEDMGLGGRASSRLGSLSLSARDADYQLDDIGADAYDPAFPNVDNLSAFGGADEPHGEGGPLDIFDVRISSASASASANNDQRTHRAGSARAASVRAGSVRGGSVARSEAGGEAESQRTAGSGSGVSRTGMSRNTEKALGLLRRELGSEKEGSVERGEEEEEVEKVLSFEKVSTVKKTTRRAASTFFFELLVLGTKDTIKLDQLQPYADIEVRAKEKLWKQTRPVAV